jgi:hypothetical protein
MMMGGMGRSGAAPNLIKPVTDIAQKSAKAGTIKSVKLKIKMGKNGKQN